MRDNENVDMSIENQNQHEMPRVGDVQIDTCTQVEEVEINAVVDEDHDDSPTLISDGNSSVVSNVASTPSKPKMTQFEKKKKLKTIATKIASVSIWVIGILLMLLCVSNLYQQIFNPAGYTGLFGIGEAVVASDSMEPKLYANDLIFYKEVDPNKIAVDDIVVYKKTNSLNEEMLIVHKIIAVGDGYVTTQGINNAVPDESFPISAVVGKYMFKIWQAGVLLNALSTPMAPFLIILMLLIIFALRVAFYYYHKKKVISNISTSDNTRSALDHFFDI